MIVDMRKQAQEGQGEVSYQGQSEGVAGGWRCSRTPRLQPTCLLFTSPLGWARMGGVSRRQQE